MLLNNSIKFPKILYTAQLCEKSSFPVADILLTFGYVLPITLSGAFTLISFFFYWVCKFSIMK